MLTIRPIHLNAAREFVRQYHRHNIPPVGGKFAISVCDGDRMCGVAICGRPVSRRLDGGYPHEMCRWRNDETPDADDYCSQGERKK